MAKKRIASFTEKSLPKCDERQDRGFMDRGEVSESSEQRAWIARATVKRGYRIES
jgi:hypothetical protein